MLQVGGFELRDQGRAVGLVADAGVIDQDVDAPEGGKRRIGHALAVVEAADVALEHLGATPEAAHLAGDGLGGVTVRVVVDRHVCAGLGEGDRRCGADAAARAGDHGHAVCQTLHALPPGI